jgi:tetratricopeptide (TPR) repeat protein
MPQTVASANLKFTNHWIGIYDPRGPKLIPSKRAVQGLTPAPAAEQSGDGIIVPADPSTLVPVFAGAVAQRERQAGPASPAIARASANLGMFLLQLKSSAEAEAPLRRAVSIDQRNADPSIHADRESLALALDAQGKRNEALELFQLAAAGTDNRVAARSWAKLAELDRDHDDLYYGNAVAAEEKATGPASGRVAVLLQEYALALRSRNRDLEAEPLLRRALSIQKSAPKAEPRVTIGVLNTLGNLLEGRQQLEEAEKLERAALALAEEKLGPESPELAMTCTNLADVLWNERDLRTAGRLFRRAIVIDASLYGPDRPETAADIANLGMLMFDAGQTAAAQDLLRQALAIYEKTLGPDSDQARFVRDRLTQPPR